MAGAVTLGRIDAQERRFADAFAAGDISLAADLYHPAVVYLTPTTRLFGWDRRIEGIERTLEFIRLTITDCHNIVYQLDERAVLPDRSSAYARIMFDWDTGPDRLRSTYVVVYRYLDEQIAQQELYYDPGDQLERIGDSHGR